MSDEPKPCPDGNHAQTVRIAPALQCNFCGKCQSHVDHLITSDATGALICNECVGLCVQILEDLKKEKSPG